MSAAASCYPPQPKRAEVVIIGGGIVGLSTAYALAQQGISVVVCEKGEIGKEQSGRNQGWVRIANRDPAEIPLMLESFKIWEELSRDTQDPTGFVRCGTLSLCSSDKQKEKQEAWVRTARDFGIEARLLTSRQVAETSPGSSIDWRGGLFAPLDGRAEPGLAPGVVARAAIRLGATVMTQCAVRAVETAAGRISGVVTEHGTIACSSVILCGGVWSTLFARNMGIRLPQLQTMSTLLRTAPLSGAPDVSTKGADFMFRKRRDGGYTVGYGYFNRAEIVPDSFRYLPDFLPMLRSGGHNVRLTVGRRTVQEAMRRTRWQPDQVSPFELRRELDPVPSKSDFEYARRNIARAYPAFKNMQVQQVWAGMIDVMPDAVPVISAVDAVPGFFISSGFSGHGFGLAPAAGRLMADLVRNARPLVDPTSFRFERVGRLVSSQLAPVGASRISNP